MELSIDDIVMYLPYRLNPLKVMVDGTVFTLEGVSGGWNTSVRSGMMVKENINVCLLKPLLEPLTEHNLKSRLSNGIIPLHALLESSCFDLSKMDEDEIESYAGQFTIPELLSLQDAKLLASWHFDIGELIPAGLAIDINTLS